LPLVAGLRDGSAGRCTLCLPPDITTTAYIPCRSLQAIASVATRFCARRCTLPLPAPYRHHHPFLRAGSPRCAAFAAGTGRVACTVCLFALNTMPAAPFPAYLHITCFCRALPRTLPAYPAPRVLAVLPACPGLLAVMAVLSGAVAHFACLPSQAFVRFCHRTITLRIDDRRPTDGYRWAFKPPPAAAATTPAFTGLRSMPSAAPYLVCPSTGSGCWRVRCAAWPL